MLGDLGILDALKDGRITIDPFSSRQLGPNSYDIRLGPWYYRPRVSTFPREALDPYNEGAVKSSWLGPFSVDTIYLHPGETILCHTLESIGTFQNIVGRMQARSTIVRLGLTICKCGGSGDVGYSGRWTMEMTSLASRVIAIPVGMRVGQILFEEVQGVGEAYEGKYGRARDWSPEDMLPKAWLDWDAADVRSGLYSRREMVRSTETVEVDVSNPEV